MVWRAQPDCQHLDNHRQCRVLHEQTRLQRVFGVRPNCVLDQLTPPRDGEWSCDEQLPRVRQRPSTPAPMPRKQ